MHWYYSKDATQHGPVSLEDLQSKLRRGEVSRDALVWRDGMGDWTVASTVAELAPALPAVASDGSAPLYTPPTAVVAYPPVANARPTSGLAITSLIFGILGLTSCFLVPGIVAVICGHIAMGRTDPLTGDLGGRGLAVAGLVLGYICVALLVVVILFFVGSFGIAMSTASL